MRMMTVKLSSISSSLVAALSELSFDVKGDQWYGSDQGGHLMREPASSKVKLAPLKLTCHPHPSHQTQSIKCCKILLSRVVFLALCSLLHQIMKIAKKNQNGCKMQRYEILILINHHNMESLNVAPHCCFVKGVG